MKRTFKIDTIIVRANNLSDCAHGCRYCPIKRRHSVIALERYERFVARMRGWLQKQRPSVRLHHMLGYHHNYAELDLLALARLDGAQPIRAITLGGLPHRTDAALRTWLDLLMRYGLRTVHATFGGGGATHDAWNNKPGNFDALLRTLNIAGELGLSLGQRLLVGRSTLASLEPLVDMLEALPSHEGDWRYAMPFFYNTEAQKRQLHVESDRIDESRRAHLPDRIRGLFCSDGELANLSEREWIEVTRGQADSVDRVPLVVHLTARNIEQIEHTSIDEIIGKLEGRTRRAYAAMPTFSELRERYGDASSRIIYAQRRCVEMKWLDRHRRAHPELRFKQNLTHCWFGG
ncbi:MAG: hypothetical protein L0H73_15505 [Nitrococcus sp.]|nr:hypothetical protein [Nitrococcus sp.]